MVVDVRALETQLSKLECAVDAELQEVETPEYEVDIEVQAATSLSLLSINVRSEVGIEVRTLLSDFELGVGVILELSDVDSEVEVWIRSLFSN